MSEFEQLIELDFTSMNEAQFKKMLKLIISETGRMAPVYLQLVQCKALAAIYKELKTP